MYIFLLVLVFIVFVVFISSLICAFKEIGEELLELLIGIYEDILGAAKKIMRNFW